MVPLGRSTAIIEGANYLLDMETTAMNKKRPSDAVLTRAMYNADDSKMDESYISFLDNLAEFWQAKFVEEDEDDPIYLMFLDNLKEHGNGYMLDVSEEHGVSFPIKYEVEDEAPHELKRKTPKSRKSTLIHETNSLNVDNASTRNASIRSTNTSSPGQQSPGQLIVDEAYRVFMSGLKVVADSVFYEFEGGMRVYYEMGNEEASVDVEVEAPETTPRRRSVTPRPRTPPRIQPTLSPGQPTPLATAKVQCITGTISNKALNNSGKNPRKEHAWFRKELKSMVRKPYNRNEYEDLLGKITARSPLEIHKETRRGGYSAPGRLGKSYLDTFPDLHREINKVKSDSHKVLNLLRGFFLYLQSTPHGVPRPWLDESCKRIMLVAPENVHNGVS